MLLATGEIEMAAGSDVWLSNLVSLVHHADGQLPPTPTSQSYSQSSRLTSAGHSVFQLIQLLLDYMAGGKPIMCPGLEPAVVWHGL